MKRDMKLIRAILEYVEKYQDTVQGAELDLLDVEMRIAEDSGWMDISRLVDENYPLHKIHYHSWLCVDAGFVVGRVSLDPNTLSADYVRALTWKGHDVLDELRETLPGEGLYRF